MKKTGLLNHRLSAVIAAMGHGDLLVIADAGLPIPDEVERIDLAVVPGLPGVVEVARAVALELQVERTIVATELHAQDAALAAELAGIFPDATEDSIPHTELKAVSARAKAVVRTGEVTPYANVVLVSGVTF